MVSWSLKSCVTDRHWCGGWKRLLGSSSHLRCSYADYLLTPAVASNHYRRHVMAIAYGYEYRCSQRRRYGRTDADAIFTASAVVWLALGLRFPNVTTAKAGITMTSAGRLMLTSHFISWREALQFVFWLPTPPCMAYTFDKNESATDLIFAFGLGIFGIGRTSDHRSKCDSRRKCQDSRVYYFCRKEGKEDQCCVG